MSVEPPSSGRPTGPPSGPLSGPSQPPSGPPSQPPGSGGGTSAPEPRRPWWGSAPRVALIAAAVVAAVVLAVVFTRSDGGSTAAGGDGEVFLQAAGKTGPDPFTESTAKDSSVPPVPASPTGSSEPANAVRGVDGGAPGLYGGTRNVSSCDVEKQVKALQADPAKNKAFASVAGVQPSGVPAYLRALTPVQLRMDTRVTNHGYRDGAATSYQAVLQAGTAVLVDGHGVPRTRCACGNPLTPPVAQQTAPKRTGDTWSSYRPSNVVVVAPSTTVINVFVIYDADHHDWIGRHRGDTGHKDHRTDPPARPSPSVTMSTPTPPTSPSTPTSPASPLPCVSLPAGVTTPTGTPSGSASPCPPSSKPPSSLVPSPPSSEPPSSESSGEEPLAPDSSAPQPPLASDTTAGTTGSARLSDVSVPPAV
ncbi:DUF6777 domain-containing protein [Streptomyces griseorubiginosus]|uniref:DUF6777 domain-containing protein n=1 Tax=Streptomyces griseorubiginosus TaxID=67304 RepID=UPI002E80C178|nr:DUF6777 domain-containing protein [Streptomyces griseorubiginosus]WUB49304.1 hypothetical protein OHN19_40580 [Streptomyces griseorubiginosus]WUB57832.1 hypothetical protein OG942_40590 [Streptomyces griseorubiginosus]